jgi:hypothetical protein
VRGHRLGPARSRRLHVRRARERRPIASSKSNNAPQPDDGPAEPNRART